MFSFIRALIPVMRALPSRPNHHEMGLIPNIITLGIKFQQMNFREPHSGHSMGRGEESSRWEWGMWKTED